MKVKQYYILLITLFLIMSCNSTGEKNKSKTNAFEGNKAESTEQSNKKFKQQTCVFDNEKILTAEQSNMLDTIFHEHEKNTTNEIVIVTTPDYSEFPSINMFAIDFGIKHGIGKKENDNGVVIVFSKALRGTFIATGSGTELVLTDEILQNTIDSLMIPKFKQGLYFEGLRDGSVEITKFLEKSENQIKIKPKK